MSRTWLVRGAVAAVLAVLAAAWVLGIAGLGSGTTAKDKDEADGPKPADVSTTSGSDPLVIVETTDPQSAADETSPSANPSEDAADDPSTEAVEVAADEPSRVPVKSDSKPTPKPSPSPKPTPTPRPSPTPTPTQPAQECTDLVSVVDCILAPITTKP